MNNTRDIIGNKPLRDLMIPGTHNSGSYGQYSITAELNLLEKLTVTQDTNVWNQLMYGIRYLDLRVGYYGYNDFWINHDFYKTKTSLRLVIEDVKRFLQNTNEVVIMDFHRFPIGFNENATRYRELVAVLREHLGNYMLPVDYGYGVTMNDIWSSGKRLLLSFNTRMRRVNLKYLWPGVHQFWGDTHDTDELETFLERKLNGISRWKFSAVMAHLTIKPLVFLFNPHMDVMYLANLVNREITVWFRDRWNNRANIVASDFFLGNNLVEICIATNQKQTK